MVVQIFAFLLNEAGWKCMCPKDRRPHLDVEDWNSALMKQTGGFLYHPIEAKISTCYMSWHCAWSMWGLMAASHITRVYILLAQKCNASWCNGGTGTPLLRSVSGPHISQCRCKHTIPLQVRYEDILLVKRTLPGVVHEPRHFILRMDLLAYLGVEQGEKNRVKCMANHLGGRLDTERWGSAGRLWRAGRRSSSEWWYSWFYPSHGADRRVLFVWFCGLHDNHTAGSHWRWYRQQTPALVLTRGCEFYAAGRRWIRL